jgi:hypothetical protein
MLDGSNIPHVERANPEDFIHLFLNNSERLVEFLEHLVKVLGFANIFINAQTQNMPQAERTQPLQSGGSYYCCLVSVGLQ